MLLPPKTKTLLNAEAKFNAAVTGYFVGLGARPSDWYHFELDTPAGALNISVYDDWVATRFSDVPRGTEFTKTCGHPCNPYSGKWNFHYGYRQPKLLVPTTVLAELDHYFDLLMHWQANQAPTCPRSESGL